MSQDDFQLSDTAAEVYESQKVKAMFQPLAEAMLKEVEIKEHDLVLDVACGTGIVGRLIEEQNPNITSITGADLNIGMIAVAKNLTQDKQELFDWHQADVCELPFEDDSFTLAFCQQGLQFFPEKVKALTEIRRVLKPNGRLALSVWGGISPFFSALYQSLSDHVDEATAQLSLAPFAFRDELTIKNILIEAGYTEVKHSNLKVGRKLGAIAVSVPKEIAANPIGSTVLAKGNDVMAKIVRDIEIAIQPYKQGDGFIVPQESHLFQARA